MFIAFVFCAHLAEFNLTVQCVNVSSSRV